MRHGRPSADALHRYGVSDGVTDDLSPDIPWHLVRWTEAQHVALPPVPSPEATTPETTTDAFGLAPLNLHPARVGEWIGTRARGASVNAYDAHFSIHSAGTHTECAAHVSDLPLRIADVAPLEMLCTRVLHVTPTPRGNDRVITRAAIEAAWAQGTPWPDGFPPLRALILRARPLDATPHRRWSGTHPPFFSADAMALLVARGIEHLVTDLPSVDPEQDGGKLAAHRSFFALEGGSDPRTARATITELAWIPQSLPTDLGLLRLDVLAWPTDASPSRPVFYPFSLPR